MWFSPPPIYIWTFRITCLSAISPLPSNPSTTPFDCVYPLVEGQPAPSNTADRPGRMFLTPMLGNGHIIPARME